MTPAVRILANVLCAGTALTFSIAAFAQTLEVAGSTTVQKSIIEPTQAKMREAIGIDVKVLPVGSGRGLQMLFEGKVKVAAISDTLEDAVTGAKKAGATSTPAGLKMHLLSTDELIPIVHPDNPVKELSKEQLRGLLTGKIQNWKEVGGGDVTVTVVTGAPGSASRAIVEKQIMGGAAYGPSTKELRSTAAELGEVARDKGAMGYVGSGLSESARGKVKEIKAPKLVRPLALVTIGEAAPDARKLIDYLQSAEAKKLYLH